MVEEVKTHRERESREEEDDCIRWKNDSVTIQLALQLYIAGYNSNKLITTLTNYNEAVTSLQSFCN
jgi:hypothetical protein